MRRMLLITLTLILIMSVTVPRARAIDPVTMAILAPIALKVAEAAKPYLIRSLVRTGKGMIDIGKDAFELLYLPYGIGEMTIGAPFKKFRKGIVHVVRGGVIAPIKLFLHILILPVHMAGAKVNI
ncbi:MAG: hypothetical protein IKA71_01340 [Lentisphaeria bacterium]|nr:hypothetical protein [Lentisphaeria bacterium]